MVVTGAERKQYDKVWLAVAVQEWQREAPPKLNPVSTMILPTVQRKVEIKYMQKHKGTNLVITFYLITKLWDGSKD